VNARLALQKKHGVVLIPTASVQHNANSNYVFVVNADSTVSVRNIEAGTTDGEDTEVVSGLAAGDPVVVTGAATLAEGTKVAVTQ